MMTSKLNTTGISTASHSRDIGEVRTKRTVVRFAHAYEAGAGTERYLDDLDYELLRRNPWRIVRIHLTRNPENRQRTEEKIGLGSLVRVPLPVHDGEGPLPIDTRGGTNTLRVRIKYFVRDSILYQPPVWWCFGKRWLASRRLRPRSGEAIGAGAAARCELSNCKVDLVVLHFFGGADADEVAREARAAGVPIALLNHYSNDRYLHPAIRKHVMISDAAAGVNGLHVPSYIRSFTNLSDGIDTEFFRRELAQPLHEPSADPLILLPARVTREKGQLDLVRVAASLQRKGVRCSVAFAGRVDSSGFVEELKEQIARERMESSVRFLGALSLEQLRDWYAASAVVALPTYHHEGLPRIVLEAQSMEAPLVCYASGGLADGIDEGRTGFLIRAGDLSGLEQRLELLLTTPELRAKMGTAGRRAAEKRFSLGALADRHERFYEAMFEMKAGGSVRNS